MAITPGGRVGDASPLGKPGSKRKLSDYEREVARAIMRKGRSRRDAIRIARGVIDRAAATGRWGKGRAKPNVRAGAAASVAQRKALVDHAHGLSAGVIDLAGSFKDVPADKAESEMKKRDAKKILRRKT